MGKIALAFAAASFSGLGGTDATAAPAFWQGAWGHPPTAMNDTPPVTRPDGGVARPVYAPLSAYKDTTVRQAVRICAQTRKATVICIPTTRVTASWATASS